MGNEVGTVVEEMSKRQQSLQTMDPEYRLNEINEDNWRTLVRGGQNSMVSDQQLAHFANDVYKNSPGSQNPTEEGLKWIVAGSTNDYGSDIIPAQRPDLLVRVYKQLNNPHNIVIAFRGTKPDVVQNLWHDLKLAMKLDDSVNNWGNIHKNIATQIINKLKKMNFDYYAGNIAFTGHSLGATLAEIVYYQLINKYVYFEKVIQRLVLFDSPGIHKSFTTVKWRLKNNGQFEKAINNASNMSKTKIRFYFMTPNLINTLYSHCGQLYVIYPALYDVYTSDEMNKFKNIIWKILSNGSLGIGDYLEILLGNAITFSQKVHSMDMFKTAFQRSGSPYYIGKIQKWPHQKDFIKMYARLKSRYSHLTPIIEPPEIPQNPTILPNNYDSVHSQSNNTSSSRWHPYKYKFGDGTRWALNKLGWKSGK